MSEEKEPATTEPTKPATDNTAPATSAPNKKTPTTEVVATGRTVWRHVRPGHPLPNDEKGGWGSGATPGFNSFSDW